MKRPPGSILAAYKREVREAQLWLRGHRQGCVQCSRALRQRDPQGAPCLTGQRIQHYTRMNEEIVSKLAALPDGELIQGTLF